MEHEPVGPIGSAPKPSRHSRHKLMRVLLVVLIALIVAAIVYVVNSKLTATTKDNSKTAKVLTINDLDNTGIELDSEISDASIENLTKELKAKIEKQISDKENPIDTVTTLIGILCNTANANRQYQCIDYITGFLDTKMDTLKLSSKVYGQPDELQVMYWRAQFYGYLVGNYEFIMNNKFTGSDGKPLDTTAEQLKYINLYLEIAQNSANWGESQVSRVDGHKWYRYDYKDTDGFIERRKQLEAGGA